MIFEGDHSVIEAIKEKKRLMDAGQPHEHIKPVVFVDGGLMKGSYGVGAGLAMEELGLNDVFTSVIGVSSGAPSAAYFVAKQTQIGASLVWEECCSRKFLNMWRFWNQVNTEYFMNAVRGSTDKRLSVESVLQSPTKLFVAVSDFQTGKPHLIKPTNEAELFNALHASILMPNVSSNVVTFNDIRYVDGGFTHPHALKPAIETIDASHLLIIANQDKVFSEIPRLERFLNHTFYRHRMPKPLRFAAHERKRERMKVLDEMSQSYPNPYAIVWGDRSIRSMERSSTKVRSVVEHSRQWWMELFEK